MGADQPESDGRRRRRARRRDRRSRLPPRRGAAPRRAERVGGRRRKYRRRNAVCDVGAMLHLRADAALHGGDQTRGNTACRRRLYGLQSETCGARPRDFEGCGNRRRVRRLRKGMPGAERGVFLVDFHRAAVRPPENGNDVGREDRDGGRRFKMDNRPVRKAIRPEAAARQRRGDGRRRNGPEG